MLLALAAGGTAWLWHYRPDLVADFEAGRIAARTSEFAQRLETALAPGLPAAKASQDLSSLLTELVDVDQEDRLGQVKRRALDHLCRLQASSDLTAALATCEQWIALDERDFDAKRRRCELLMQRGPEAALPRWIELFAMLPEDPHIARGLCSSALQVGDAPRAAATLVSHLRAAVRLGMLPSNPNSSWDLELRQNESASSAEHRALTPRVSGDALELSWIVPVGTRHAWLRPPARSCFALDQPQLSARVGSDYLPLPAHLAPLTQHLHWTATQLLCSGHAGAALGWDLGVPATTEIALRMTGTWRGPDLAWTGPVMSLRATAELCEPVPRDPLASGMAQTMQQIRDSLLQHAKLVVVGDQTQEFPTRSQIAGSAELSLQLAPSRTRRWLVRLPAIVTCRLHMPGTPGQSDITWSARSDVRRDGDGWVVTGPEPQLELEALVPGSPVQWRVVVQ